MHSLVTNFIHDHFLHGSCLLWYKKCEPLLVFFFCQRMIYFMLGDLFLMLLNPFLSLNQHGIFVSLNEALPTGCTSGLWLVLSVYTERRTIKKMNGILFIFLYAIYLFFLIFSCFQRFHFQKVKKVPKEIRYI